LAAILFPVFAQAKEAAKKTACLSQTKQVNLSMIGYSADYEDFLPPVNGCDWGSAVYGTINCTTYPYVTQPYTKNWMIHRTPGDGAGESSYGLMPDDSGPCTNTADKGVCYGWRSSYGYNFLYLSLPFYGPGGVPNGRPTPQSSSTIGNPANTLMTTTSIWDRTGSGTPKGGGNWAVNAPCIYSPTGGYAVPTSYSFYYLATRTGNMWDYTDNTSPTQFGYTYPFFTSHTIVNSSFVDGHAKGQKIGDLVKGCNVTSMVITDTDLYMWDLK